MNYDELVSAAKSYADRNDAEVNQNIDVFILMAESRINRKLQVRKQTHRIFTQTFDNFEYYALPKDYAGMRAINFTYEKDGVKNTYPVTYITPNEMDVVDDKKYNHPMFYTIVADQIRIYPVFGGGTLEVLYYRKVPPLTKTNTTNWLSEDSPDIYLSGIIAEIESFVKNAEAAQLWDARMTRAINELTDSDVGQRWAGAQLVTRAE